MSSLIRLRTSDGVLFEIEEAVAMELQLIAAIIEDNSSAVITEIPIPNVDSKTLAKVIEYCKKHVNDCKKKKNDNDGGLKLWDPDYKEDALKSWDAEYMASVDNATLTDLLVAANYLNVQGLLDLACQTVADMMKGKSPEELRKTFNIKNDFTPEEEEEIRKEHPWLFV